MGVFAQRKDEACLPISTITKQLSHIIKNGTFLSDIRIERSRFVIDFTVVTESTSSALPHRSVLERGTKPSVKVMGPCSDSQVWICFRISCSISLFAERPCRSAIYFSLSIVGVGIRSAYCGRFDAIDNYSPFMNFVTIICK